MAVAWAVPYAPYLARQFSKYLLIKIFINLNNKITICCAKYGAYGRVEDVTSSNLVYTILISQFHPKLFVVGCFRLRITFKAIQQKVFQKTFIGGLGSSHFLYWRRSRVRIQVVCECFIPIKKTHSSISKGWFTISNRPFYYIIKKLIS